MVASATSSASLPMREHFHVPDNYFLSHSVGCQPKCVQVSLSEQYFGVWKTQGGNAWPGWMQAIDRFRSNMGRVLGVSGDLICPQTNVSSGLTKILYSLPGTGVRKTILLSEGDFPTIGFALKQAEKAGYRLRFLSGDISDVQVWADAMDDSVGLVHITHALSNTSQLAPVKQICDLARDRGVISIVDIAQSVGALAIDLGEWAPDFAIGTGLKYLCFGPGACFLYASAEMVEACEPIDVGWFSHENPFEMDIHNFRFAPSAMRFFGGTASPAPFILANAALELWQEIGMVQAQERAQTLLSKLLEHIPDEILVSPRDQGQRGAALVIDPPQREALGTA
ncbi:MAG: aminotransferase class V-fold PLP-dependent enzyme, partial [Henriciella sp.]|nr:aminotransferase class V-fold PLP-dependent enzyme [Henriciella sp.]